MDPLTISLISAGIQAAGSIGGSLLSQRGKPRETRMQKQKRGLMDDLLASVKGEGRFSNLFNMDEAAFKKSFADPARSRFDNVTSPQIQQQFIQSGMQRGTGLEDTLTRAGVDMDNILNQHYQTAQQGAMNRQLGGINTILGGGDGVADPLSGSERFQEGASGYLSGKGFKKSLSDILDAFSKKTPGTTGTSGTSGNIADVDSWNITAEDVIPRNKPRVGFTPKS